MGRLRPSRAVADPIVALGLTIEAVTGRGLDRGQVEKFSNYLAMLATWNKVQRLTGSRNPSGIVRDLFADSVLFLSQIPSDATSLVDLGSGPGIPGVPIHIVRPQIAVTLVEAKTKRISFLHSVKRELGLTGVTVLEGRAEALVRSKCELAGHFDVAVSRSVGLGLAQTALEYLRPGGLYVSGSSPAQTPDRWPQIVELKRVRICLPELGVDRSFMVAGRSQ